MPEANHQVVENPTIDKTLEEGSSNAEKEVKQKSKEKDRGKEKDEGKGKDREKARGKAKKKKSNLVKLNLIGEKHASYAKEPCSLAANIIHPFREYHISFDVFSAVNNLDELFKLLVYESNLYAQMVGNSILTNKK